MNLSTFFFTVCAEICYVCGGQGLASICEWESRKIDLESPPDEKNRKVLDNGGSVDLDDAARLPNSIQRDILGHDDAKELK